MSDEAYDALVESVAGPAEASDDAGRMKQHPIPDQIAADKHLANRAGASSRALPIRFGRIRPPGAI